MNKLRIFAGFPQFFPRFCAVKTVLRGHASHRRDDFMPENRNWSRYLWLGIVGLALAVVVWITASVPGGRAQPRAFAYAESKTQADSLSSPFKTVYEAVSPAVVGIKCYIKSSIFIYTALVCGNI